MDKIRKVQFIFLFIAAIIGAFLFLYLVPNKQPATIVASVNGEVITLEYLNNRHNLFGHGIDKYQFLNDEVIPAKILLQEAEKRGIKASKEEIENAFSEFVKSSKKEFMKNIKKTGMTERKIKQLIEEQVIVSKLVQEIIPKMSVADKEIKEFYDKNIAVFTKNGTIMPFGEVKERIKEIVLKANQEIKIREYVTKLGQQGEVVMYDPDKL